MMMMMIMMMMVMTMMMIIIISQEAALTNGGFQGVPEILEQFFPVVLFIRLLFIIVFGAVYYAVRGGSNFCVCDV